MSKACESYASSGDQINPCRPKYDHKKSGRRPAIGKEKRLLHVAGN